MDTKNRIARRIAKEIHTGEVVNCGIGIPTLVPNHLPPGSGVMFQSENGILGVGPSPPLEEADPDILNAFAYPVTVMPGGVFLDSVASFGMIRGGVIDVAILGAIQVDEQGDIANWTMPGQPPVGIGGGMDLANGAKRVIAATEHCSKDGTPKILKKCTYPLTAQKMVTLIVSEKAVIEVTPDGLVLKEVAGDSSIEEVVKLTEADLTIAKGCTVSDDF